MKSVCQLDMKRGRMRIFYSGIADSEQLIATIVSKGYLTCSL